ncbi:hypothetical protein BV25DRAFT_1819900 [Artomyces pyxidatus]|uniref:Uncharacterized protein n=1 Tax=Artomyces pyxidatus TaxID=48021 RepID=A0ACB8TEE8_9AGAM|nr:hypothetical protein BV25DRAFT_1819900 [Artomyces pyxidatus]
MSAKIRHLLALDAATCRHHPIIPQFPSARSGSFPRTFAPSWIHRRTQHKRRKPRGAGKTRSSASE